MHESLMIGDPVPVAAYCSTDVLVKHSFGKFVHWTHRESGKSCQLTVIYTETSCFWFGALSSMSLFPFSHVLSIGFQFSLFSIHFSVRHSQFPVPSSKVVAGSVLNSANKYGML